MDRFRIAIRVVHLANTFAPAQVEAACAWGLAQGDTAYATLKRFLQHGGLLPLGAQPALLSVGEEATTETLVYARTPAELAAAILGGEAWS